MLIYPKKKKMKALDVNGQLTTLHTYLSLSIAFVFVAQQQKMKQIYRLKKYIQIK